MSMPTNLSQLTRCPACDDDLGVPPTRPANGRWRRASLLLEVCSGQRGTMDWQLSLFDGTKVGASSGFHPAKVSWVYRLCGDGHVFLDHMVMGNERRDRPEWLVEDFDVVAAIGGVAAGKSYLLLRTLSQHLTVSGLGSVTRQHRPIPVNEHTADWLEETPLQMLVRHYRRTEADGMPLEATTQRDMLPFRFLSENVSRDIVEKILEVHEKLAGKDYVDRSSWGRRIRQPIVRRYRIGNRRVLAAIADLAGEQFARSDVDDDHRQRLLRNYGTLVWVIDPVISRQFSAFLPSTVERGVLAGSMRPANDVNADTTAVQRQRSSVQHDVAATLAQEAGPLAVDEGTTQHLLVCITKVDLVHLALRGGQTLHELGRAGAVVEGVARYLAEIARRASGAERSIVVERAAVTTIVEPISQAREEPALFVAVARQFATAIVDHYSNQGALWDLAHVGGAEAVKVPEGIPNGVLRPGLISVPSLNTHIADSLTTGQAGVLRTRDLVMSALGCGIAYGLGFDQSIERMLDQPWRDLRFFLCSPLAEVPVKMEHSAERIEPLDSTASFPERGARSAALSQLLLCLLRRMRP